MQTLLLSQACLTCRCTGSWLAEVVMMSLPCSLL